MSTDEARPLIFWGASGQAKVLYDFLRPAGFRVIATFDSSAEAVSPFPDVPCYEGEVGFRRWHATYDGRPPVAAIAIGSPGQARMRIQELLNGYNIATLQAIHPAASVAHSACLGTGCQVLAQAVVAAETVVGDQCIVNTSASVDHESTVGHGVHLGPGARVLGCVNIGDFAFIGGGAVVLSRLKVGTNSIVGAGAIVTKDIPDNVVVYGNPASIRGTVTGWARPR